MITIVLTFLRTSLGQYVLVGSALAAAFGILIAHERSVGSRKELAKIERQGAKTDARADEKRRAAESRPDLGRYYRD